MIILSRVYSQHTSVFPNFELGFAVGHTFLGSEEQGYSLDGTFRYKYKRAKAGVFITHYNSLRDRSSIKTPGAASSSREFIGEINLPEDLDHYRVHRSYQSIGVELIFELVKSRRIIFELGPGYALSQYEGTVGILNAQNQASRIGYHAQFIRTLGPVGVSRVLYRINDKLSVGIQLRYNHDVIETLLTGIAITASF